MAAPILKIYTTTSPKLQDLPVVDGQLIFTTDNTTIYLDLNGQRLAYNIINTLQNDNERLSIVSPLEGYYFVISTRTMWFYRDYWVQITTSDAPSFGYQTDVDDFPPIGDSNTLYLTSDATYKWDDATQSYLCVSNKTEWKGIED